MCMWLQTSDFLYRSAVVCEVPELSLLRNRRVCTRRRSPREMQQLTGMQPTFVQAVGEREDGLTGII